MDVDALISAVYKRFPIWDKRDKLYSNRTITDKLWKEIATEVKKNEETIVRKKWKYLGDNFAVEYSKRPVTRSGDAADSCPSSKWQYFTQLLFLKDIVTQRSSSGSLKSLAAPPGPSHSEASPESQEGGLETTQTATSLSEPSLEDLEVPSDTELQPQTLQEDELSTIPARNARANKRKRGSDDYYKKLLEIEAQKFQYLENKSKQPEHEDEDLMFYKSVLPHVREISKHLKLEYQSKIQSIVQEFAYVKPANHREPRRAVTSSPGDMYHGYEAYSTSCPAQSNFSSYSGGSTRNTYN